MTRALGLAPKVFGAEHENTAALMALPRELDTAFWDDIKQFEEEKKMPFVTTPERIGFERGLEEGLEKGKLLGEIKARLEMKFGPRGSV